MSPYNDRWTHLLLAICQCTMESFTKSQINWCYPHPVDYWKYCWWQKEALLTNCCHKTIYQIYAHVMSLTHWYQQHHMLPPRIWWQLTCTSLSFLFAIWSIINLVLCEALECYFPPDEYLEGFYHSVWRPPTALSSFCHIIFPMLICSLTINAYPEMWKFWKNYHSDIKPCQIFIFQNMSKQCQYH